MAADGRLKSIGASPFANLQTAPCWVEITHNGRFLFTVNTAVPSISSYAISPGGSLRLLGSTVFNFPIGTGASKVSGFKVRGGRLTELSSSPTSLPTGSASFGIVVTGLSM